MDYHFNNGDNEQMKRPDPSPNHFPNPFPNFIQKGLCWCSWKIICFFTVLFALALGLILGAVFAAVILAVLPTVIVFAVVMLVLIIALLIYRYCVCNRHDKCD